MFAWLQHYVLMICLGFLRALVRSFCARMIAVFSKHYAVLFMCKMIRMCYYIRFAKTFQAEFVIAASFSYYILFKVDMARSSSHAHVLLYLLVAL